MTNWDICLNDEPYSCWQSTLRSLKHEQIIINQWKDWYLSLGSAIPEGKLSARLYVKNKLDNYGQ